MKQNTSLYGLFCDLWALKICIEELKKQSGNTAVTMRENPVSRLQSKLIQLITNTIITLPISDSFKTNTEVVPLKGSTLSQYIKDNNIQEVPIGEAIYFTVRAMFEYNNVWPKKYTPNKKTYHIPRELSFNGSLRTISGFSLSEICIGRIDGKPVAAKIDMGDGFVVTLYDLQAFVDWLKFVVSDFHYVKVLSLDSSLVVYDDTSIGRVFAPCVSVEHESVHHLKGLKFFGEKKDLFAQILDSKMNAKMALSSKGVRASAETEMFVKMSLGGSSVTQIVEENTLYINTGLVMDISYQGTLLFRGFIPQSEF